MDLEQFEALLTDTGQELLRRAGELAPEETTFLACYNKLSKQAPSELVRAALETALLRRRARRKFRLAERMYFLRQALEQASSESVARYRASRFAGLSRVADLCCGIGGDTLALAGVTQVLAVERDSLRLRMARCNVKVYEPLSQVEFLLDDVLRMPWPRVEGVFVDPDRRVDGRRVLSLHDSQPPLHELLARLPKAMLLGVKLAPGVPLHEVKALDAEEEFISLNNELKECVLWFGAATSRIRRATLLPSGATLLQTGAALPPPIQPRAYLYDPDPAIVRSGLIAELAELLHAPPIDTNCVLLTSDCMIETPFAQCWRLDAILPYHLPKLRNYLREQGIGRVQITRRGSAADPVEVERKLKLPPTEEFRTLVLTRVLGRAVVLVCQVAPPTAS